MLCEVGDETAWTMTPTCGRTDVANGVPLSDVLLACARVAGTDRATIADVVSALGDRSIEVLLLILALPMVVPIPAPGISVAFGVPMMLLSLQLAIGRQHIWLPGFLIARPFASLGIAKALERSPPVLVRLEHIVRPRLFWLSGRWARMPVGLVCLALAAVITLPVPFGHFVPGLAICFLALGLLERDGFIVGLGLLSSVLSLGVVTLASVGAMRILSEWWMH